MSAENPNQAVSLVAEHKAAINRDLASVTAARGPSRSFFSGRLSSMGEEDTATRVVPILEVVTDPRFILAMEDGRYKIGSATSAHVDLLTVWQDERFDAGETGIYNTMYASGITFQLLPDPEQTKIVRFDQMALGDGLPPYASRLDNDGFLIFDAEYKHLSSKRK